MVRDKEIMAIRPVGRFMSDKVVEEEEAEPVAYREVKAARLRGEEVEVEVEEQAMVRPLLPAPEPAAVEVPVLS